jgi:hypothetical protein
MPNNLKDLRLEYLDIHHDGRENISLEFLRQQPDLKALKVALINTGFSSEDLSMICELKQLETLELEGTTVDRSGLNKLYQLEKLKRLRVDRGIGRNILDHLKFGTFNDLEELHAFFEGASVESIQEMSRITPNLKKIDMMCPPSDTINTYLETLENLEIVTIRLDNLELSSENVYPKIKHLDVHPTFDIDFRADQFPNLEFLKINGRFSELTESFFVDLLSDLKRLKTLEMDIRSDDELDSVYILSCFEKYGNHLETVKVHVRFEDPDLLEEPHGIIGIMINKEPNKSFCFEKIFLKMMWSQIRTNLVQLKFLLALTMKVQIIGWQFWELSVLNGVYTYQLSSFNKFASTK